MDNSRYSTLLRSTAADFSLVILSVVFLPFSLLVTIISRSATYIGIVNKPVPWPAINHGKQVKVLVTGVSMAKGLFLARTMFLGGCKVIGADFEKYGIPACGRYSQAVSKFYSLKSPQDAEGKQWFFNQVLEIVSREQIDIWISCSGVATAIEDAQLMQLLEKNSRCKCFQFNEQATYCLDDKFQFMQTTTDIGLKAPQWYLLESKGAVEDAYVQAVSKTDTDVNVQYILKNVAMDDKTRGSLPLLHSKKPKEMKKILDSLDVKTSKWIMQEFIPGNEEYCTQALVIDGRVKAFLSCPSESVLMHYKQVPSQSALDEAMLKFTQTYAQELLKEYGQFTGHLSFDFLASSTASAQGTTKTLLPIECNPRCHTAVVRFRGREKELAAAYLSILPGFKSYDIVRPDVKKQDITYYWIAHDLVELYVWPVLDFLTAGIFLSDVLIKHLDFWKLVLAGKDPTFEWWDPVPWLALNHVYWPGRFLAIAIRCVPWSQVNVSTGKIFEA